MQRVECFAACRVVQLAESVCAGELQTNTRRPPVLPDIPQTIDIVLRWIEPEKNSARWLAVGGLGNREASSPPACTVWAH